MGPDSRADGWETADQANGAVVPSCYSTSKPIDLNPLRQVLVRSQNVTVERQGAKHGFRTDVGQAVRVAGRSPRLQEGELGLVATPREDGSFSAEAIGLGRWVGAGERGRPEDARASWEDAFTFKAADTESGRKGLRAAQIGALHAVLGYWTTRNAEPATVVMPTGTGKTETMLALLCAEGIERLLVIVPSDALRSQIADKFETLGLLQPLGIIPVTSLRPVVGQVKHRFATPDRARDFAQAANVVVTTPAALSACAPEVRAAFIHEFTHLFVDEAHHVEASTWNEIRDGFEGKPVVQFTATPFREDGRHLGGRLIYSYPLREAQREKYFSEVNFISVLDLGEHDRAVAQRAVEQLRADLDAGLDHLMMARVSRIGRAADVAAIYEELAPDLAPVVLHSAGPVAARNAALSAIRDRTSRIIVCVNMLGEGFDLPSLKVAAIHDPHKSLGVTLQFVGRFARVADDTIGEATVIVGRPSGYVDPSLRRLYAEDADWNVLIRDLSQGAVGQEVAVSEFEAAFGSLPEEVTMRSLLPKMSTVAYKTGSQDWDPHGALELFPEDQLLTVPMAINARDRVAWFVTEQKSEVKWGDLRTVEEVVHHLYVLYWNRSSRVLFINSSNKDSLHEGLAKAVCGETATRITGEPVYRSMAGMSRLVPTNVGLLDVRNRSRRFSMHVGADVTEGFPVAEAQTKSKTNIFAYGFEEGTRVSIGASLKGRIWSHRVAPTLKHWVDWCDHIGAKLLDEGLSVDDIMRNFIRPELVETRPELVPLAIEWPWEVFAGLGEELRVEKDGVSWPLIDTELLITEHSTTGPIPFTVTTPEWESPYRLELGNGDMKFTADDGEIRVTTARSGAISLSDFLNRNGLYVFFEQDAFLVPPAILLKPDRELAPFDRDKLRPLNWTGIDLTKESQGPERDPRSIQARMIEHVMAMANWDIVIDDDGSGEMADIVALRADGDSLVVHLTHCKWVAGGVPRSQVIDLYEVCGQAQKSTQWRRNIPVFLQNLIRREKRRVERGAPSGFLKGDARALYTLEDSARLLRPEVTIAIAQPGLTAAGVSAAQLELLAATETYVYETTNGQFEVFTSS